LRTEVLSYKLQTIIGEKMEKNKKLSTKPEERTDDLEDFSEIAKLEERLKQSISTIAADSKELLEKVNEEKEYLIQEYQRLNQESKQISENFISQLNAKLEKKENELISFKQKILNGLDNIKKACSQTVLLLIIASVLLFLETLPLMLGSTIAFQPFVHVISIIFIISFLSFFLKSIYSKSIPAINKLVLETAKKETSLKISEVGPPKIKNPSFKDSFSSIKNRVERSLSHAEELVLNTVPFIKTKLEIMRNRERYKNVVSKFILSMSYYGIDLPDSFKNDLIRKKPLINEEAVWEASCAMKTKEYLEKTQGIKVSETALELLYREHIRDRGNAGLIWKHSKKKIITDVAKILFNSGLLPKGYAYEEQDVMSLLETMVEYDSEELRKMIYEYGNLVNIAKTFRGFLYANGIVHELDTSLAKVYDICKNYETDQQFNLLIELGKEAIGNQMKGLSSEKIEGFALFSLPIFFNRDIVNLEKSCKLASRSDTAVKAVFAYFEMIKDYTQSGQKDLPKIINVIKNLDKRLDQFEKKKLEKELEITKASLSNGEWDESTIRIILKAIKKETEGKESSWELVRKNEKLISAIRSLFQEVKVDTIERVLESQLIMAYLINFDSRSGGLQSILEELTDETKTVTKYGVPLVKNGVRKYKFVQYTRNARVGIIPRKLEMNFEDFKEMFLSDVKLSVQKSGERGEQHIINPNVTVHRVMPSKISFGRVSFEGLSNVTKGRDIDLIELVRSLSQEEFCDKEIVQISMYDGKIDLLKILNMVSVFDLIKHLHDRITKTEKEVLSSPESTNQILKEMGSSSMIQLCKEIGQYTEEREKFENNVSTALARVLEEKHVRNYEKRAKEFAKSFVLMLSGLSTLFS